jgi:ATP-dependent exoDNAse (exonuclease V) beta subunit
MVFFRHVFFKKPPNLKERYIKGKRHYESPTGSLLPSVTTVLSLLSDTGIKAWRRKVGEVEANKVMEYAMKTGTEMHSIVENYLNNRAEESDKNPRAMKLFEQMKPELDKIDNIVAQEVPLYSDGLGVAGRVDCIAEYDGKLSIIDFKSSRKKKQKSWIKKYFLQATAYALMYEEMTGDTVEQIVILISADDDTVIAYVEDKNDHIEQLKLVIEDYRQRKNLDFQKD